MNTRQWLPKYGWSGKYACVYCSQPASTDDHTPPKGLLRPPLPSILMTLPSCQTCNGGFSWDEETVKAFLGIVSSHPDLRPDTPLGMDARKSIERDPKRKALIEAQRSADGNYRLTREMLRCFDVVFRKSVRGLYYGLYRKLHALTEFQLLSIEDARATDRDSVVDRLRPPRVRDITNQPLPEVSESMHSRIGVVTLDMVPVNPTNGEAMRAGYVFQFLRNQPVDWFAYQPDIFTFGFVQMEQGGSACVIELWSTLLVSVSAPWPGKRGPLRKGKKNLHSRESRA